MRFSAPYIYIILRGIYYYKGPNFTFTLLSCAVNINTEYLHLCCWPSPQLVNILVDILTDILVDILVDILSVNWIKILKEEKVDIIKDFLY